MNFNLNVTEEEGNIILTGLGKLPYEVSASIINNIQAQAQKQMLATKAEAETNTEANVGPHTN